MDQDERLWFTQFEVSVDDRADSEAVWSDAAPAAQAVRKATAAERFSILLVGGVAIALLVAMVVTLIIGAYLSSH